MELTLRIILEQPPAGVDFGVQKGHGVYFETLQIQRSKNADLTFEFNVRVDQGKNGNPNFLGPFAQGPPQTRFVYLDIGTCAGQLDTPWSRRLKVPLTGITWELLEQASNPAKSEALLVAHIAGTGKDGGPTCGTVKPFEGWKPVSETTPKAKRSKR
jgi:hypothetical protein